MATITRTISAAHKTRLVNAMCIEFDYDTNKTSGETEAQFANRMLDKWLKDIVLKNETDNYSGDLNTHLQTEEDDYKVVNPEPTEIDIT